MEKYSKDAIHFSSSGSCLSSLLWRKYDSHRHPHHNLARLILLYDLSCYRIEDMIWYSLKSSDQSISKNGIYFYEAAIFYIFQLEIDTFRISTYLPWLL
jgi:hypothetical protein